MSRSVRKEPEIRFGPRPVQINHHGNPVGKKVYAPLEDRLYSQVKRDIVTNCWMWTGGKWPNGYGQIGLANSRFLTHRVSYTFWNGPIPDGMQVCHRCDVRACVNPDHMFLGTSQDNHNDMQAKKRSAYGTRNKMAKLTEQQALAIFNDPEGPTAVARKYGVHNVTVCKIKNGQLWSQVTGKWGKKHGKAK